MILANFTAPVSAPDERSREFVDAIFQMRRIRQFDSAKVERIHQRFCPHNIMPGETSRLAREFPKTARRDIFPSA